MNAANTSVILPVPAAGTVVKIGNRGANPLAIYPDSGANIDALAANAAYTLPVGKSQTFSAVSATRWLSDNRPPQYN